ncbi:hypothetical protein DYB26_007509 [Aphanomyces astaci]|uniref:HTH CENPB-type domain-containing protein n=1 Tax=Aphanomyces astaci TaxID=112090 RepID=A0A418G3Q6_APHAT|nr:hypothetical protein DYB26_007509 [Aphanomyces astaci]
MVRFASGREDVSGSRRRGGDDSKVAFENDLYAWICGQRAGNGAVISPPIVQQQALVVAKTYTNMNTFQASRGWYYRFCNRKIIITPSNSTIFFSAFQSIMQASDPSTMLPFRRASYSSSDVWETSEPVANPLHFLYSDDEMFSDLLCPRCRAFLRPSLVQALPLPWKELPPDGDDAPCFYDATTHLVVWSPPAGCSAAARRVFAANGTIFAVCACRIPWERRRHILRHMRMYAIKYKEEVHVTLAAELRRVLARCKDDDDDESCCRL